MLTVLSLRSSLKEELVPELFMELRWDLLLLATFEQKVDEERDCALTPFTT